MSMSLKANLLRLRSAKAWTQAELARRAGVSQQVIADIESGRTIRPRQLHEIAAALGTTVEQLDPEKYNRPSVEVAGTPIYGDRDLPIYAAAEGGDGSLIITFDPIAFTLRPAPLIGVKGGYGMYVVGESMMPAYEAGDTVLVNPHLPPTPGRDAVFFQSDGHGQTKATIKRLLRITSGEWRVLQHNPQKEFALDRVLWSQCQLIVGKYNR
jgi:phage repressor protein C with HTH and peptisase S24 domain